MPTIDMHSHFFPKTWPDLAEKFGTPDWPWLRHLSPDKAMVMKGKKDFRPILSTCWDLEKRLEEMDRNAIDYQIMCATPILFAYDRPPEHAAKCARLFNDLALEMLEAGKGRIFSLAQVPLQDTDAACREVERAAKNGHVGVQIGNHVGDRDMDDEGLITFLHHCADLNVPVLVHPWDMMARERMNRYMLQWLVAMPAETQLSILYLILSGAFERLPRSLKICFAHGGGSFAFLLGRVENAWHHRDIVREHCVKPPSFYTDRFYVDSIVFREEALDLLCKVMRSKRVLFGSDYPFPLGEQKLGSLVRNATCIDQKEKNDILGNNAANFFDLKLLHKKTSKKTKAA